MDRKPPQGVIAAVVGFLVLLGAVLFYFLRPDNGGPPEGPGATHPEDHAGQPSWADPEAHLALGNPSNAAADPDNHLLGKPYFALSYNDAKATPNWVSWCLKKEDLGKSPRFDFFPDPDLPKGFKHVIPGDYAKSGFDRGHLCPHSDRAGTDEASRATFTMANMIPQAPTLNRQTWADLESYCRDLVVKKHQTLYIVAGPAGRGGTGSEGHADALANGKVTVPAKCWKVILALDGGTGGPDDAGRVTKDTRLIAVEMPNAESVEHDWAKYRTSVKDVEALTGYHFFDRVPAGVIGPLKQKVDREPITAGGPRGGGS